MTDTINAIEAAELREKRMATKQLWDLAKVAEHLCVTISKARGL